jgi:hypothetical protein
VRTEVLELDDRFGAEYSGRYVFAEISWAKRSRIIQKYTKYNPISGQIVNSDYLAIQAETIWASLRQQPATNPVTLEKLLGEEDGVSVGLGEIFSQVVNRLNCLSVDETRFLSGQSAEENPTQHSRNSDSAKNSAGPQASLPNSQQKQSINSSSSSTS